MKKRLALLALLALLGAAGVVAIYITARDAQPRSKVPRDVPARWQDVRTSAGHQDHLALEDVGCADCHGQGQYGVPSPDLCASCHDNRDHVHGATAAARAPGDTPGDCLGCHAFGDDEAVSTQGCARCHDGDPAPALDHHGGEDCRTCHNIHKPEPLVPTCAGCHDELARRHGDADPDDPKSCLTCHDPHEDTGNAADRCAECHATNEPRVAAATALRNGHDACVGCHQNHDFVAAAAAACTSCHEDKPLMAVRAIAHRACESCHPPHDVANAEDRCEGCHKRIESHHPTTAPDGGRLGGAPRDCVDCHPPHPRDSVAVRPVAACAKCHGASSSAAFHAGGVTCADCHAPHEARVAFVARGTTSCAKCHTDRPKGKAHADCAACHPTAAHKPKAPRPACGTCHADNVAKAAAGAVHAACAACHGRDVHAPKAAPACASCHAEVAQSAPAGHRDQCSTCHTTHDAKLTPKAACASCHADRTTGPHQPLACDTCHRPHGPDGVASPPACTTCHEVAKLPALHAVPKHQDCASCHGSHSGPRSDRATCITCHADRKDHEPRATKCSGCHPFGGG